MENNETKHTPGPWKTDENGVITGGDYYCTSVATTPVLWWREGALALEAHANARLIAAAPDLLWACVKILASLEWEEERRGTTHYGYEDLKAAIAKARGEA